MHFRTMDRPPTWSARPPGRLASDGPRGDDGPSGLVIPFNKPYLTGRELAYIAQAHASGHLAGDGEFTEAVHARGSRSELGMPQGAAHALVHAALEMAALLLDLGPGDEVIMPSFTFVSTANAFVLRGATPVFVDVRPDTLNLDER